MARIEALSKPYPETIQAAFEKIMGPGVPPLVLFTTVASSERAWRKFSGGSLLDGKLLSLRERELIIDRVCARTGCEYEWRVHVTAFADAAALTKADIASTLAVPLKTANWTAQEAALLAAIDALHERASLNDEEFARLKTYFDDEQILEVLMLAGFYRTVAYIANGLNLPLEPTAARFGDYQHD